jgi:Domain of unknown function (DUF397)
MNWRKATYSGNGGNCVEVSNGAKTVAVRDSKDEDGAHLAVPASSWSAFTARIRRDK